MLAETNETLTMYNFFWAKVLILKSLQVIKVDVS